MMVDQRAAAKVDIAEERGWPGDAARTDPGGRAGRQFVGGGGGTDNQYRMEPPTTVVLEQYWACSRWSFFQKFLLVMVGLLLGLVVGLAVWLALLRKENPPISDIFQRSRPAPD